MVEASTKNMGRYVGHYVGRFAPSPTGPLHFGSLVAAVASYLDARSQGGDWLLRMEDIDSTRCRPQFAEEIPRTLFAFGFQWDGEIRVQSRQLDRYQSALDQLKAAHLTYACSCSRKEIADSSTQGIDGPVYGGVCRDRDLSSTGNAIRIRTTPQEICIDDRAQGRQCQRLENDLGDFVLKRRDGLIAYQLAVVVDDADQQVTHVVRGADLLDSTARQIYLQQRLNFPTPSYLHIPVVTNPEGQKLSKQTLAPAISAADACRLLRDALLHLGQSVPGAQYDSPVTLLEAAIPTWQIARIPRRKSSHIS